MQKSEEQEILYLDGLTGSRQLGGKGEYCITGA